MTEHFQFVGKNNRGWLKLKTNDANTKSTNMDVSGFSNSLLHTIQELVEAHLAAITLYLSLSHVVVEEFVSSKMCTLKFLGVQTSPRSTQRLHAARVLWLHRPSTPARSFVLIRCLLFVKRGSVHYSQQSPRWSCCLRGHCSRRFHFASDATLQISNVLPCCFCRGDDVLPDKLLVFTHIDDDAKTSYKNFLFI